MRAHRPPYPAGGLTAAQRLLLLTGMAALVILGVVYWLALISAARSVSDAVEAVSGFLAPPRPTDMPRLGAVFKKSPLESDLDTPTPAPPLAAPAVVETPPATASPLAAITATAEPIASATASAEPSAPATATMAPATPTARASATAARLAATAAPTDAPQPTVEATATTDADASDATEAEGRAPRLVMPQPEPGELVDAGAVSFEVRVRADAPLATIKAAVDNQAQAATLEQVSDSLWVVRFQATLDTGSHRVWVRARDAADREGSYAWQVEAR